MVIAQNWTQRTSSLWKNGRSIIDWDTVMGS
jgi:hypothetical protein